MLKGLDPRLHPDLLDLLARMGHGDRIAVVDRNYPAETAGPPVVRLDGLGLLDTLHVVLSVFPLDTFDTQPVAAMDQVGDPFALPEVQREAFSLIEELEGREIGVGRLERYAFYEAARGCAGILINGEQRPYGDIILTKGVL